MKVKENWNTSDIGDQSGKIVVITGANGGLGSVDTKALAEKGAHVIMACRNMEKANSVRDRILKVIPNASIEIMEIDLSDFDSVKDFASKLKEKYQKLNILINNAGSLMGSHQKTKQGYEMRFGVNHLGHFMLTGLLLPLLLNTPNSRVVNVSSLSHKFVKMDFDNLNWEHGYNKSRVYGRSKLENLLFTYEFQRRLTAAGKTTLCMASHPGMALTHDPYSKFYSLLSKIFSQSAEMGALPTLYAATDPNAEGGKYYGPGGFFEIKGYPKEAGSTKESKNLEIAKKLWEISEELTGIHYALNGKQ